MKASDPLQWVGGFSLYQGGKRGREVRSSVGDGEEVTRRTRAGWGDGEVARRTRAGWGDGKVALRARAGWGDGKVTRRTRAGWGNQKSGSPGSEPLCMI